MANDMDGAELFVACLAQATAVVKQVRPEHFANSTPNADWSVRDLLTHMMTGLCQVSHIVAGETVSTTSDTFDADLIGDDIELSKNWQAAADRADLALSEIDPDEPAHLSSGDLTMEEYLMQTASDLLIHAWDLGKSIGVTVRFDNELAEILYEHSEPEKLHMHDNTMFSQVEVIGEVDIQTRLLALFGRRSDWHSLASV